MWCMGNTYAIILNVYYEYQIMSQNTQMTRPHRRPMSKRPDCYELIWWFQFKKKHAFYLKIFQRFNPLTAKFSQFEFSPTWSCVSLTRSTTSSEWKLFRFAKKEVKYFQILLVDVTFYL